MTLRPSNLLACVALFVAFGAAGCRGAASGVACGTTSATPIASEPAATPIHPASTPAPSAAQDPAAPVLAPGENRPRLTSAEFSDLHGMVDAAAFAPPSRSRLQGSLLVATTEGGDDVSRVIEIDVATLKTVREVRLPVRGYGIQVAASEAGAVVVVRGVSGADRHHDSVFVLSPTLELEKTMQTDGQATSVAVDRSHAVYATAERGSINQLVAFEIPNGDVFSRKTVQGELADEWVPTVQVVAKHDRVWLLKRGRKHYELLAFSADLSKLEGRAQMDGTAALTEGPEGFPGPHYGDGLLAPSKDGVIVVRFAGMKEYDTRLQFGHWVSWSKAPAKPAVDDATGRFLLPTGELAARFGDQELLPLVVFRRGTWRWSKDGEVPLRYDEPVAAFFIGGRGVIVTRYPGLRVSVLDWSAVPVGTGAAAR
jgi:hypothetical protein